MSQTKGRANDAFQALFDFRSALADQPVVLPGCRSASTSVGDFGKDRA